MKLHHVLLLSSLFCLSACSGIKHADTYPLQPSAQHIHDTDTHRDNSIPQANKRVTPLPFPKPSRKIETYSVIVTNVPAQEILFALARDAKVNLDIHPGIHGSVTLNAINQTLAQILNRISKQLDIRYELDNGNLTVMPDSPYLRTYQIDYVNMTRDADGGISNATQVESPPSSNIGGVIGNNSNLSIKSSTKNHFWERLESNVKDILRETDKILPAGSSETFIQQNSNTSTTGTGIPPSNNGKKQVAIKGGIENSPNAAAISGEGTTVTRLNTFREAASVITNPENGIMTVRATSKQHEKIQEFISHIMTSSHRQVLIEATIVEIRLSEQYQQGVNWSNLNATGISGFQLSQNGSGTLTAANTGNLFTLNYSGTSSDVGTIAASIKMMESFGTVKVLSSPKLSVMNNQTAMLRVVDNYVYFTISATTVSSTGGAPAVTTYSTTSNSVPVGFTMAVTPQINESDTVLLNLRPSITRLFGFVNDPNPDLAKAGVVSQIPQTQTREMESVLRIENNQIAVMGGLMQDEINHQSDETPLLGRIPLIGGLFKYRNDKNMKSELVIFLRPIVIKEASTEADYSQLRDKLPNSDFFNNHSVSD
jgi:general secretion pathway protein D